MAYAPEYVNILLLATFGEPHYKNVSIRGCMNHSPTTLPRPWPVAMAAIESVPALADAEAVGLRLRAARKDAGLSTSEAARLAGISVSQLGSIERGHHLLTSVSAGSLRPLAAAFGLSWRAFVGIIAPVYAAHIAFLTDIDTPIHEGNNTYTNDAERVESDFLMKPVYGLAEAGKPVAEMHELEGVSPIPVRRSDLRPNTVLFQVSGESMQTAGGGGILPGNVVFVDVSARDAVPGRVCVIAIGGGGVCIKRVRQLGGALWLFSDNPDQDAYPPFQAEEARIIGWAYFRQPRGEHLL